MDYERITNQVKNEHNTSIEKAVSEIDTDIKGLDSLQDRLKYERSRLGNPHPSKVDYRIWGELTGIFNYNYFGGDDINCSDCKGAFRVVSDQMSIRPQAGAGILGISKKQAPFQVYGENGPVNIFLEGRSNDEYAHLYQKGIYIGTLGIGEFGPNSEKRGLLDSQIISSEELNAISERYESEETKKLDELLKRKVKKQVNGLAKHLEDVFAQPSETSRIFNPYVFGGFYSTGFTGKFFALSSGVELIYPFTNNQTVSYVNRINELERIYHGEGFSSGKQSLDKFGKCLDLISEHASLKKNLLNDVSQILQKNKLAFK
ncbi:hypothetical protein J4461_02425 [Candidatus Pacearchaeota archaeon]|nr:hypothetical protein [Candidatus Pacearchaeota archaeon]